MYRSVQYQILETGHTVLVAVILQNSSDGGQEVVLCDQIPGEHHTQVVVQGLLKIVELISHDRYSNYRGFIANSFLYTSSSSVRYE